MKITPHFIALITLFLGFSDNNDQIDQNLVCIVNPIPIEDSFSDDFIGVWVNVDDETRSITKCEISSRDQDFVIHVWGACHPSDCDWGERMVSKNTKNSEKIKLLWDQKFSETKMLFEIEGDKLKLSQTRKFKDDSGRPEQYAVDYFKRE